ncbi:MAG TPA: NAD-dependent epimerase/dehydratase family protein [Cytophagales bacterium]|nr:NAD-dependent epimerase/dehydratase family protein [Cytophagales bacterium]
MEIKVIITGATGMVGEGVLLECLQNPAVKEVLMVNRHHYERKHAKLKELIVPDFLKLEGFEDQLAGYNACFFCAGVSSLGMKEAEYTRITYDTTLNFARTVASLNPGMVFTYVSGAMTDSTEKGSLMWARVKGRTENDLMKLPFKGAYNFRPGFMKPTPGQKSLKPLYKFVGLLYPLFYLFLRNQILTLQQVGRAMINSVLTGYDKQVLEIRDIKALGQG